ncbi:ATP-dependent Zn protease [Lacticaseibacillus paracasei]|nr:ATP-dependent Zn protease [Lacticaseibacillus paracasei]
MKKKQNGLFSSTLTYIIIFVLLVTGFAYYMRDNGTTSSQEIETSTFLSELKKTTSRVIHSSHLAESIRSVGNTRRHRSLLVQITR